VDVHGKKDRKANLDVDVDLGPMEVPILFLTPPKKPKQH
jgi:hypothetical protein